MFYTCDPGNHSMKDNWQTHILFEYLPCLVKSTYTCIHKSTSCCSFLFLLKTHCIHVQPWGNLDARLYDSSIHFTQTFQIFKDCQQHLAISLYSVHITIELWSSIEKMSKGRTHFFVSWIKLFLLILVTASLLNLCMISHVCNHKTQASQMKMKKVCDYKS